MRKLVYAIISTIFIIGFLRVSTEIKRANFQQILHKRDNLKTIVKKTTPQLYSRTRKFLEDRLILNDGCVIILGHGNLKEKLMTAFDILKKEKNVVEIDVSTPGYAVVKNGGKK